MGGRLQEWFSPLKRLLPPAIWQPARAATTAIVTPIRFSVLSGHWRSSLSTKAVHRVGDPIPWYTYPMIDFLSQRSFQGRRVLEFGGGQSTFWWAARAHGVITIEADADWYETIRRGMPANVDLHHVPVDAFDKVAGLLGSPSEKFDVIIVDGHLRREAAALAFDYLAPDGALILDNAEGYGFYEEIKDRLCRRIDFFGFAPGVSLRHCTALVFTEDCFLLKPDIPIPNLEEAGLQ